jgi:hypothetical protein
MKSTILGMAAIIAAAAYIGLPIAHAANNITVGAVGFATPESVEYYAEKDLYLVSNINGSPTGKDGNGFISQLSPSGRVLDLKWIDGSKTGTRLNAPKGMAINGGILYVADLDEVHLFELPRGRQLKSVQIAGSTFLNGITPNPAGGVFVTDSGLKAGEGGFVPSGTDAVYEVTPNGRYRAILKDPDMGRPNGIIVKDGLKIIVTFGTGSISAYQESGSKRDYPAPPAGALDGLLQMNDGSYLMSSWQGAAIYRLDVDGNYQVIAKDLVSPADLGFDSKRNRILVPLFLTDEVRILAYTP